MKNHRVLVSKMRFKASNAQVGNRLLTHYAWFQFMWQRLERSWTVAVNGS
jgi:hypothetical protein